MSKGIVVFGVDGNWNVERGLVKRRRTRPLFPSVIDFSELLEIYGVLTDSRYVC